MFNAFKYIKVLEAVGFGRDQAEAQVELVLAAIEDEVASKGDILEVRTDFTKLRAEFGELKGDFAELRVEFGELKGEFAELKIDFAELRVEFGELKGEFAGLRAEFGVLKSTVRADLAEFKSEMLVKLGGTMIACSTIGFTALALVLK